MVHGEKRPKAKGGKSVTVAMNQSLEQALEHCRQITRRQARNFYYGLKLTPEPKRSALYAIYAWMRRIDDIVDDAGKDFDDLRERVGEFRVKTEKAIAGNPLNDDPIWISLADVVARFDLEPEHFHSMIEGQLDDLTTRHYESFEELRQYCYRVASVVGLICIQIWGCDNLDGKELAIQRGIAFQLTNIIRDFREDFEMGRVYMPAEDFSRHDLTPEELRAWSKPDACARLIQQQITRAEEFYQSSQPLDAMIHPSCFPALGAMTAIYQGTLEKIRREPSRIAGPARVSLSSLQKSAIALQARWRILKAKNGAP